MKRYTPKQHCNPTTRNVQTVWLQERYRAGYKGLVNSLHKIFNFQTCVVQRVKSQVISVRAILFFFQIIFLTAFFVATKSFIQLFSQMQWQAYRQTLMCKISGAPLQHHFQSYLHVKFLFLIRTSKHVIYSVVQIKH